MSKHTPGPWTKSRNVISDQNGQIIAAVDYGQSGYVQANARLIAASPEMYEALKGLVSLALCGVSIDTIRDGNTMEQARAILNKLEVAE